ncbi:hypothetical protein QL285_069622 [Trifolium repens]|nr:hypothetical protein QL285_069622 [Trifolium repens]
MIRAGEMKLLAHCIKSIEQKLKERCADSSPLHLRWRVFNKTIVNDADTLKYLNQVSLILNSTFQIDRVLDTDRNHRDRDMDPLHHKIEMISASIEYTISLKCTVKN